MGFFEGPEKLMEVWWTPILEADNSCGFFGNLRTIPSQEKPVLTFCAIYGFLGKSGQVHILPETGTL